jgi:hypothetical protein
MVGHYSDTGLPLIELPLHVRDETFLDLLVIIDSGFNRTLVLNESAAKAANLPPSQRFDQTLYTADGSPWPARITTGYVKWLGSLRQIDVLVVEDDPGRAQRNRREPERGFLGMDLLRGTNLLLGASTIEISLAEG